jgi:hypothetical protein
VWEHTSKINTLLKNSCKVLANNTYDSIIWNILGSKSCYDIKKQAYWVGRTCSKHSCNIELLQDFVQSIWI